MSSNNGLRTFLLWLAAIRFVVSLIAIPLAPFLYREHFIVLVLMRPTKEVLLAAGFLIRAGKVDLIPVVLAALPLLILGVWLFFYLGKAYCEEITKGKIPGFGGRIIDADKINKMGKVLDKKGSRLVFLGRLAAFPSTVVAAAAGACKMRSREFLPFDGAGGVASVTIALAAGYLLGETYENASPIISVIGVLVLVGAAVLLGRYLKKV
jgi:membrane protein DedA with SNARE-associated domain